MSGENIPLRRSGTARRYAPFLAIAALQLLLLTLTPGTKTVTTVSQGLGTGEVQAGDQVAADESLGGAAGAPAGTEAAPGGTAAGLGSNTGGTSPATGVGTGSAGAAASGTTGTRTAAASTGPATAAAAQAAPGPADSLGRPTTGDKSKCAPGGLLQENVTVHGAIPCIPRFVGDNGGATSQGVTRDSIQIVMIYPKYPDAVNQALIANGLSATPEQYKEVNGIFAEFINKHYELYGRKVKIEEHFTACADATCIRAEAKAVNEKFKPFMAAWYVDGITGEAMWDQFAQLGVITIGAPPMSDAWFKQRAPYVWKDTAQGFRVADMVGDYYCKKMSGKNATLAGDIAMRVKKRKLGIIASDNPAILDVANRFKSQVSGGSCGSAAEGTTIYTLSDDPAQRANQMPTLVTRKKNDGITTQTSFIGGTPGSQEDDKQQFYPENLLSGLNQADDDFVGRFGSAAGSATQMGNTFGVGWFPKAQKPSEHDNFKAVRDVNPNYTPAYVTEGPWGSLAMFAKMLQWAGPNLTPKNVESGAHTSVQINGYSIDRPWPGWKGGNPHARMYKLSGDNSYSGLADAREVYWDQAAISPVDNQPGAWVCVSDCKRFQIGQWPKGEPKQNS